MPRKHLPRRNQRLTLEQHKEIGFQLKQIEAQLRQLHRLLQRHYGKSASCSSDTSKAWSAINSLRCELDNLVIQENQLLPPLETMNQELINCYYGTATEEFVTATHPEIQFLLNQAIFTARNQHDGHLTMMRFSTGWKVCFGTPELDTGNGREQVLMLPLFETLEAALEHLLAVQSKETE